MTEQVAAARAMGYVRQQRHSVLNHLQVISGWLQLGRADRASQYIESVAERFSADAKLVGSVSPAVGLTVLELQATAESLGVYVNWRIDLGESDRLPDHLEESVREALRIAAALPEADRHLVVQCGPGQTVAVHTVVHQSER